MACIRRLGSAKAEPPEAMLARAALRLSSLRPSLQPRQQLRFGSGAGAPKGGGGYGSGEYRGIKVPPVAAWHQNVATIWGTMMWLWIMWRCKNDGKALLVRPPASPKPTRALRALPGILRAGNPALGEAPWLTCGTLRVCAGPGASVGARPRPRGRPRPPLSYSSAPSGTCVWSRCQ